MAESVKIAAVQLRNRPGRAEARRAGIEACVARAAEAGAQLVVLPELSHSGYVPNAAAWELGESLDGPSARHVRALTRRHRVHLGAGFVLREGDDVVNAYLLADDAGEVAGVVRKRFPEAYCFLPIDGPVAIDTRWGRVGVAICADNHRVDTLQRVRSAGVRLHLMPHAWPMPARAGGLVSEADLGVPAARARDLCRVYADHLGVPTVLVNAVGPLPPMDGLLGSLLSPERFALGGSTQIAAPGGRTFGHLDGEEDLLLAQVELGPVAAVAGDPPTWNGWLHPGEPLLRRVLLPVDAWWGQRVYRARRSRRRTPKDRGSGAAT
jgi:N-carbamoylputrescine amidase